MRVLLDTHAFLWFVWDDGRLTKAARSTIEDPENDFLVSMASAWEMAIKLSLGKLKLAEHFQEFMEEQLNQNDFELLPISLAHVHELTQLPFHHRDPFDRLLVAQALVEELPIVSRDVVFDEYDVDRIWDQEPTTEDKGSTT